MRAPMERMSRQVSRFVDVSGLRKVAQGFEWIGKAATSVLRSLTAIVPVMGAITGAASIAGMVKLVSVYADWSHELVQSADNIGITTQKLQQLQDATRLAGGNAADMTGALKALHDNISDLNIGRGGFAETQQLLNHLGISFKDAQGNMRSMDDLLPDVVKHIAALKDPADRARIATGLLGASGDKLVESFRQTHKGVDDWIKDASRYTELTNDQIAAQQRFTEAQGRLAVQFDHLGQQISAMVARDFGPLLTQFSDFVDKHTPEILAAVDALSKRFAAWLENVDWSKVEAGVNSLIDGLKWVVNNLGLVKDAAEAVAAVFAIKWAGGVVSAIGSVVSALGAVGGGGAAAGAAGGGAAAGAGLIGALGAVGAAAAALAAMYYGFPKLNDYLFPPDAQGNRTGGRRVQKPPGPAAPPTTHYEPPDAHHRYGRMVPNATTPTSPIQPQSATGFLPGGATQAAYHPAGAVSAVATGAQTSDFWVSMAAAVTKGFEDAWDHITSTGGMGAGGGGGGGGFTPAAYHPGGGGGDFSPAGGTPSQAGGAPAGPSGPVQPSTPFTGSQKAFYDQTYKDVYDAAVAKGVPHPEVLARLGAAQAAHETGYGKHFVGNNLYGIKAGGGVGIGGGVDAMTWEHLGGRDVTMSQRFARFANLKDSSSAFVDFLMRNKRYRHVLEAGSDAEAVDAIAHSGYATDPNYGPGLANIMRRWAATAAKPAPGENYKTLTREQLVGPSVTVPGQRPVNGSVDVSITHKNAPPNSAVTATGSGAVNVAPVRVEHQDMADI